MWAYLYFRTKKIEETDKITKFMENSKEQEILEKLTWQYWIYINNENDIKRAKKDKNDYFIEYYTKNKGRGDWKASWIEFEEEDLKLLKVKNDDDAMEKVFSLVTSLCCKLNEKFDMWYLKSSCALSWDYFSEKQINKITDNWQRFSWVS